MEAKRLNEIKAERGIGPVFETQVHKKEGFSEEFDGNRRISASEIFFAPGERTTMHKHIIRQILYVTGGRGIIESENERYEVSEGDMISIPPEEEHWHGAASNSTFRHISIVIRDEEHDGTISVQEPNRRRSE